MCFNEVKLSMGVHRTPPGSRVLRNSSGFSCNGSCWMPFLAYTTAAWSLPCVRPCLSCKQGRLPCHLIRITTRISTFAIVLAPFAQDKDLPLAEVLSEADVAQIFAEEKVSFGKLARSFGRRPSRCGRFSGKSSVRTNPVGKSWPMSCCRSLSRTSRRTSTRVCIAEPGPRCRRRCCAVWLCTLDMDWKAGAAGLVVERQTCPTRRWQYQSTARHRGKPTGISATEDPEERTGTPLIRWVALIGLATAAVQGFAYGPYAGKETGETALFRELLEHLQRGDIVLADRFYCSYLWPRCCKATASTWWRGCINGGSTTFGVANDWGKATTLWCGIGPSGRSGCVKNCTP